MILRRRTNLTLAHVRKLAGILKSARNCLFSEHPRNYENGPDTRLQRNRMARITRDRNLRGRSNAEAISALIEGETAERTFRCVETE